MFSGVFQLLSAMLCMCTRCRSCFLRDRIRVTAACLGPYAGEPTNTDVGGVKLTCTRGRLQRRTGRSRLSKNSEQMVLKQLQVRWPVSIARVSLCLCV